MKNIIWQRPDSTLAITWLIDAADSQTEADRLKNNGDIPEEYIAVAFDAEMPADRATRDAWRWE